LLSLSLVLSLSMTTLVANEAISSERKSWDAGKDLTGADLQRSKIKHPGDVQESLSPDAIQLYTSLYYSIVYLYIPIVIRNKRYCNSSFHLRSDTITYTTICYIVCYIYPSLNECSSSFLKQKIILHQYYFSLLASGSIYLALSLSQKSRRQHLRPSLIIQMWQAPVVYCQADQTISTRYIFPFY